MSQRINGFGVILAVFVVGVMLKIYLESDAFNLKCIVSSVDGNKYCVRESAKIQETADLLAKVTTKLKRLVDIAHKTYPNKENIQRLYKKFNPKKINEILPTSKYTAYSENKGEKLAFCTTTTKGGSELIDENTLTFVALHELSHIMTTSVGHNDEFWTNFKFIIQIAVKNNIYSPVNYGKKAAQYCGMKITDNPYYDN